MAAWEANDDKTQLTQAWGTTITLPANRAFYVIVRNKTAPNDNVNIEGKQMNLTEFVNGLPEANQTVSADKDAWKNKSVCFVGDSITADNSAGAWYKQLAAKLGVTNYTTAAVGGSCASVTNDQGAGRDLLVNRWNSIPQKDVYVIMIGTNDWGHDTPIGSVYDTTDVSFCGALNVIVNGLKTKYPASEIVFVTPMDRIVYKSETRDPGAENNAGDTLADFAMAIQAIGAKHGCMVVDAYTYSGVDPTNTAQFADGLHPTAEGSRVMVENTWEQFLLLSKFYF
jgi:lysophospholipase L1-like esterase